MIYAKENYNVAVYKRLSREDGDKLESDSIINQQHIIDDYCSRHPGLSIVGDYADDGYTGTNFNRPGFKQMLKDIEAGKVNCVIVKDLSRFGRDYIDMGFYLERVFPEKGVRFIAINDNVDSLSGPYDMLLPLKNVFNTQYAKDISGKVKSAFKAKQRRGEFVGAFASYGYLKDERNHNKLVIDPDAAKIVVRIFEMAAEGIGQIKIVKVLNDEGIPCPSEYKRLMGDKYSNGQRMSATSYWTYATVHRLLNNEMYLGRMVQNRYVRETMHGKAKKANKADVVVVENTHEAIITQTLWDKAHAEMKGKTRDVDFNSNIGLFAGYLKCADCGRSLAKTTWRDRVSYSCGSYHRYGKCACTPHYISEDELENAVLEDSNRIISTVSDIEKLRVNEEISVKPQNDKKRTEAALERIRRLKKSSYEDYKDGLISKDDFLTYKQDYEAQEAKLLAVIASTETDEVKEKKENEWLMRLISLGKLEALDRLTLSQTVKEIIVHEEKRIEIVYLFSDELKEIIE